MKRKLLAVLMAAAMAATLLAGCNNSSDTRTFPRITFISSVPLMTIRSSP